MTGTIDVEPRRSAPADRLRLLTLAVVALALANALYAAWRDGWTYDEPFHLEWTERLLVERNAGRESPHYNAKTPVLLPNVVLNRAVRGSASEPVVRFVSRLPSVAWLALLLAATFLVGRRLFGDTAAHLATLAAALDPNLAAHGSVVTVDVLYALGTLLTVAAAAWFAERPSAARAAALGAAVGLALTAKFSAILLLPVLLLAPLLARPPRREWPRWIAGALVVAAVAALVVCAAYLFLDVATPLGAHRWLSRPMRRLARALPGLRLPVPQAFLTGYDVSLAAERGEWNVVILGRWFPHGVWFYFPVLWLLKTPLLVLAGEVAGLALALRSRALRASLGARLLLAALVVHLAYFCLVFRTQVGYRFVLMCIPLGYLLAAAGWAAFDRTNPWRGRGRYDLARFAGGVAVTVALFENALFFGNPLSFTNAAVWPKKQAFRLIADSNIDWGQHDAEMEAWSRRADARTHLNPLHLLPGRDVFSVNEIAGLAEFSRHAFLRANADPAGEIGHTHVWFDVDDALFDRFLDAERRLTPRPEDEAACGGSGGGPEARSPAETLAPDAPVHVFLAPTSQRDPAGAGVPGNSGAPGRLVCISTLGGADLGLRSRSGRIVLGRYRNGESCAGETLDERQESWHRVLPGTHAFCVAAAPRPGGAEPFEGDWLLRRGSASLVVVDAPERPR